MRLANWKMRHLSFGVSLTLIKSVLSSLPLYYLSIFKMPEGLVKEMEKIQSNFFMGRCRLEKEDTSGKLGKNKMS